MAKIVTLSIDEEGNFSLDLTGFKGKGCKDVARAFESLGKVTVENVKNEMYEGPGGHATITTGR